MDEKALLLAIGQMMDEKIGTLREDLRTEMNRQHNETRTLVENKYDVICNLLKEEYNPMAKRVSDTAAKVSDYDDLKSTISDHDSAIQNHNKRLTKLEQAI